MVVVVIPREILCRSSFFPTPNSIFQYIMGKKLLLGNSELAKG